MLFPPLGVVNSVEILSDNVEDPVKLAYSFFLPHIPGIPNNCIPGHDLFGVSPSNQRKNRDNHVV